MSFTSTVYVVGLVWTIIALFLSAVEYRLNPRLARNADFRNFQRNFLLGYLPSLLADSLQAPYLYYLYQSYGFLESQIAIIYIVGLVAGLFCNIFGWHIGRVKPKLASLIMVAVGSLGCFLKLSSSYGVLIFSRIFDGTAAWLLSTAPQSWYFHHHIKTLELPPSWLSRTARLAAIAGGWLSISAGVFAEFSEDMFKLTPFPFVAAVPVFCLGGAWIYKNWEEIPPNTVEGARPKPLALLKKALKAIQNEPSLAVLAIVQSLFESMLYMFVFLWTPLFMYLKPALGARPLLGFIYSSFMASALCGTLFFKVLSRKLSAFQLLPLCSSICFVSMSIAVMLMYPSSIEAASTGANGGAGSVTKNASMAKFQVLFLVLCLYELGVGLYFPVVEKLQRDMMKKEERPMILAIFRIPLNIIACAGLWALHDRDSVWGNWLLLAGGMVLLVLAFMASLILLAVGRTHATDLPLLLQQANMQGDDEDDEG